MNAVLDEQIYTEDFAHEEDEYISHAEIEEMTRDLINKHREAYEALANA